MIKSGVFVVQYLNSSHRYGVVMNKSRKVSDTGWSFFKVRWSDGETSTERADCLKLGRKIEDIVNDLLKLRKHCK